MPWDKLSPEQRRSVALQLDYQHDPAMEKDRQDWWDFFQRMDAVKAQMRWGWECGRACHRPAAFDRRAAAWSAVPSHRPPACARQADHRWGVA